MNNKPEVVFIDDNEMDLLLIKNLLSDMEDINTVFFSDVNGALGYVKDNIDNVLVLVLDLHMPKISGIEILQHVRSKYSENVLPVIFLTGSEFTNKQLDEIMSFGATDVLGKDFVEDSTQLKILKNRFMIYLKFFNDKKKDAVKKESFKKWLADFLKGNKAIQERGQNES